MTNAEIPGISVHLFLPQGTVDGVRIAQIPGWTGRIACAPARAADKLAKRPESDRAGLHLFIGSAAAGHGHGSYGDIIRMRVSSNLEQSLRKRYWEPQIATLRHVVVITDRDDMLTGPELHWIGYLVRADVEAGGRSVRMEDVADGIPIGEAGRAQIERFMEHVRIVLPAIGVI